LRLQLIYCQKAILNYRNEIFQTIVYHKNAPAPKCESHGLDTSRFYIIQFSVVVYAEAKAETSVCLNRLVLMLAVYEAVSYTKCWFPWNQNKQITSKFRIVLMSLAGVFNFQMPSSISEQVVLSLYSYAKNSNVHMYTC
jgi:hypothetical protein